MNFWERYVLFIILLFVLFTRFFTHKQIEEQTKYLENKISKIKITKVEVINNTSVIDSLHLEILKLNDIISVQKEEIRVSKIITEHLGKELSKYQ